MSSRSGLFPAPKCAGDLHILRALALLPPEPRCENHSSVASRSAAVPPTDDARPGSVAVSFPAIPLYFRRLRLDEYRLVISSSHSFAFYVRPPEGDDPRLLLPYADVLRVEATVGR